MVNMKLYIHSWDLALAGGRPGIRLRLFSLEQIFVVILKLLSFLALGLFRWDMADWVSMEAKCQTGIPRNFGGLFRPGFLRWALPTPLDSGVSLPLADSALVKIRLSADFMIASRYVKISDGSDER